MENNESILSSLLIDSSGRTHLASSGKWAKFIGIVYLVMSVLIIVITFLLMLNLDFIADAFMDMSGMSQEALQFMMGAGKWLFVMMMSLSCLVLALNGYYLVKFGNSAGFHSVDQGETSLSNAFFHLGRYLMITAILSLLSTISTFVAIIYYIIK